MLVFKKHSQATVKYQMFKSSDGVEFIDEGNLYDVVRHMDDAKFFPNDEKTEVKDCDGNIVWEKGDPVFDYNDYYYYNESADNLGESEISALSVNGYTPEQFQS